MEITNATTADYDFITHARQNIITLLDVIENISVLTEKELDEIRNLLRKSDSELWIFLDENRNIECCSEYGLAFIRPVGKDFAIYGADVADYEFISHSRHDIISLLDEIERLRSKL
ncbi:MAG: hypothetical protein NC177_17590 [Ruminococcus flavefaciens]|nr:hypothetical protein [Ruminococcus flavefaciens]